MVDKPPRLTGPMIAVFDLLTRATVDDERMWGLRICEETDLGSGTVYPILDRLERIGWIEAELEDEQPSGRPRRRYYRVTGAGRAGYECALAERATRRRRLHFGRPKLVGG